MPGGKVLAGVKSYHAAYREDHAEDRGGVANCAGGGPTRRLARSGVGARSVLEESNGRRAASSQVVKESFCIRPAGADDRARVLFTATPTSLLVGQATCSAAEVFAMAMRELPQVQLVGEYTCGSLSDEMLFTLSNGWRCSLSNQQYETPGGACFEGTGIPPDVPVPAPWTADGAAVDPAANYILGEMLSASQPSENTTMWQKGASSGAGLLETS